MSTAVLDAAPGYASQLFFNWEAERYDPAEEASVAPAPLAEARSEARSRYPAFTGELAPLSRGQGEVRIGSVMIKLLKRYGITDEEIAEGLNNYAKKNCSRVAS